ncbi:MAG: hypothetical protein J1E16_08450 [Muribaculaceae bacterium]|nr:hypothetical protein [Muribaculaceae bacterium]
MQELPTDFIKMLHDLLGDEASDLIKALDEKPITSVRLNKRKPGAEFDDSTPVTWCKSGLYLNERPEFILDPLLHAGAYYVQDASSMIYETVVERLINKFGKENDGKEKDFGSLRILDLCAAPGGKTTAIINAVPDGSFVCANEYSQKRVGALKENIAKWGYPNVSVTNRDSAYYASLGESYDIVAVDAPCSGEGMMRKEEVARTQWSHNLVEQCATLQKEILENAIKSLKPGGFLIYSTCTFNHHENEENAEYIAKVLELEPVDLQLPEEWGIPKGINTELPVYRFMPHKTKGEGLFLSVFRKPGKWVQPQRGLEKFKASQSQQTAKEEYPYVDVDKETALSYLRRESIKLSEDAPRGMVTITYKGLPLGPAKNIGTRANNLYPKNWRILKR